MKKIWFLTTLLVSGLLLTGCNNQQYEEEFSEYWLLQWPNGTITLEDFKKAWTVVGSEVFEEWEMCNTPELACVPIILKDDNTLITPHEHNTAIEEFKDENVYFTDLKTFRKVTWLKEASPEYVQQYSNLYSFDPYVKFYKTREEKEALIKNIEPEIIDEPEEVIENNGDSVSCNDIDIDWNAEIINIDDVVENCTYEEWTAYSWDKGWCWWVMPQLYLTKDKLWMFDLSDTKELCKSARAWIIRDLWGRYEDINTFVYKYWLYKKWLIDSILPQTEEEINGNKCWFYYCDDENLCSQFYRPSYWENENHYYIYWYRYPKKFPYETLLVIDDKLYRLWNFEEMFENWWPNPIKQWKWVVYWLDWDKLIVKRYVEWELISPYTLENFNSYSFPEKTTTTKFKVKTCEIAL